MVPLVLYDLTLGSVPSETSSDVLRRAPAYGETYRLAGDPVDNEDRRRPAEAAETYRRKIQR